MRAFLKYFEMEPVEIVAGGVGSPTYRHVRWEEHGTRDRDKALAFLIKSTEVDPENRDAHYDLGLIHYECENPRGFVLASKLCLDQYPEDKDA